MNKPRNLAPGVTSHPHVLEGLPVIAGTTIPTAEIAREHRNGGTVTDMAYNYRLSCEEVRNAIIWEESMDARRYDVHLAARKVGKAVADDLLCILNRSRFGRWLLARLGGS